MIYPSGQRVEYAYTSHGLPLSVTAYQGPLVGFNASVAYDPAGNPTDLVYANGLHQQRDYDPLGRIARNVLPGILDDQYGFDAVGNITEIADGLPDPNNERYGYDALDRLIDAQGPWGLQGFAYDANGNRTLQQGDTPASYAYQGNRLMQVNDGLAAAYQYDGAGNIIVQGELELTYNQRNRLISVSRFGEEVGTYQHNALGQRISKGNELSEAQESEIQALEEQIAQLEVEAQPYLDKIARNQEKITEKEAEIEADQQAIAERQAQLLEDPQSKEEKKHNKKLETEIAQLEKRVEQTEAGILILQKQQTQSQSEADPYLDAAAALTRQIQTIRQNAKRYFVYDEEGRLIGEYNGEGEPIQETLWFNGRPVATLQEGVYHGVHTDHLGTPRMITDPNGTVVWRWELDAFGTTPADGDPDGDGVVFEYRLRFPGQYFDAETGLHYNYFRTYDSATGRYLEPDPIGLGGGLNTYLYTSANPLSFIDPMGLAEWDPDFWKGQYGQISSWTNCYGYARNVMSYKNPGDISDSFFPITCSRLMEGAKKDGLVETEQAGSCGGTCPDGYYKIQIYLDDTSWWPYDRDYHAYRQDNDGGWSHKPGRGYYPQRAQSCPMTLPRKRGDGSYNKYCGTLCVKDWANKE